MFILDLDAGLNEMRIVGDDATTRNFQDAFDGSTHYWVTINQYKLDFGRIGKTKSHECQTQIIVDNIAIWSESTLTVAFYVTCPDAEIVIVADD